MAKKVFGFNKKSDFMRTQRAVKKVENMRQTGARQRRSWPRGGGGPKIRRGIILELGDYDVHRVGFLSGTFTEDLTSDGLGHDLADTEAYVANEFDYHLEVGDVVLLAQIENKYWIIDAEPDCQGYCIDENFINSYVYGWVFRAPSLPCCPEAGGVHILTTSDSGVTYESETFQCNSDGTDRKWIFKNRKLRLSPMLDEGNLEWWTDNPPTSCTVQLQIYEPQRAPTRQASCGKVPRSVCLHPLCGVGSCEACTTLSPMKLKLTIGGGAYANNDSYPSVNWCSECEGTYILERLVVGASGNYCGWGIKEKVGANNNAYWPILTANASEFSVDCYDGAIWTLPSPIDCTKKQEIPFSQYYNPLVDPPYCEGFPDSITIEPYEDDVLESNCYPTSIIAMSTTTVSSSTPLENFVCLEGPYYLEFEITGVTDNTCDSCSEFNNTYRATLMGYSGDGLDWDTPSINPTCAALSSTYIWRIDYYLSGGAGYVQLVLRGATNIVTYTGPAITDWNCFGPNVFTYDSDNGECANWPATITVYPMLPTS